MAAGLYRAGEARYNLGTPRLAFKALERLEPCAGRLARTVLRGLRHEVAFESVMTGR